MKLPTRARDKEQLSLQRIICETPSITGFSYPFLRLLVIRAEEMDEANELVRRSNNGTEYCFTTQTGAAILYQIAHQIKGGWDAINWSQSSTITYAQKKGLLEAANCLLSAFEKI